MPTFTVDQQKAIDLEGSNIIVSAGAGSGKTAVLSERVLRKLRANIPINKLLILTFTNEAANEMKERIRKKIGEEKTLSSQLDLLDSAYITTFDSFSLSMVRKYHYLLNVSRNISILDVSIVNIKKREFIDEIFDSLYVSEDPKFLKLITDFCVKDDQNIKEVVYNLYNDLDKQMNKVELLTGYVDKHFSDAYLDSILEKYQEEITKVIKNIEIAFFSLTDTIENGKDEEKYQEMLGVFEPLIRSKSYEEIKYLGIPDFKLTGKLSSPFKEKAKKIKESAKELKDLTRYDSIDAIKNTILATKDTVDILLSIITKLDQRLWQYKRENDSYTFNDIALMAIKLVEEHEDIQREIKEQYNEILLDEYQDTSDVQEKFMSLIENNNLYMVGDVKQSIYRFRNANPLIFKNKYDAYSNGQQGIKIDLVKNFRSREEVLNNINQIFNLIMDDRIGGANYKASHQMQYGLTLYQKEPVGHDNHLEIYNYAYTDTKYTKEEIEAFIIARDIKEKIKNGYLVFDKDTSKVRKASYKDFCIIMDRGTAFSTYKKIFEYLEVPLVLYMDQKLNDEEDILVLKNLINFIIKIKNNEYDQEFKYYFTSIARSYLYRLSDQEIFLVFKENCFKETEIYSKCEQIARELDTISSVELLDLILDDFHVYEKTITTGGLEDSLVRIDSLKTLASNLANLGYTPFAFCDYLNKMNQGDNDIKYSLNNKIGDNVKIMNIHKSKGLEFPVCYFSGFHKKFNLKDVQARFLFDNQYGIITPYYKEGIGKTILHTLAARKYYQEEISEKIRLFYVALTRAREKMIMVTSLDAEKEIYEVSEDVKENYRSFLDILESIKMPLQQYIKNISLEEVPLTKAYDFSKNVSLSSFYHEDLPKISLKEFSLSYEKMSQRHASKTIKTLINYEDSKNLDMGTQIHYLFEIIDFKDLYSYKDYPYFSYIERFVKHLEDISTANIYKEYAFAYEEENTAYSGIIDLLIEYKDRFVIVDYKLKNIDDPNYEKQLGVYQHFLSHKTNKPIETYLYSILEDQFKKVNIA